MDRQKSGVDQREQLLAKRVRRTKTEWEEIALKVMLLHSEWAAWIRDNYRWREHGNNTALRLRMLEIMKELGVHETCSVGTFIHAIAKSLRTLRREAREAIKLERQSCGREKRFSWKRT
jgi:phosphodiesterase/alkaline phosphatase D-like protein